MTRPGVGSSSVRPAGTEARRYAIAAAAIRLFAERGLDATTVDDIAAAADISPRTFFRHFSTKEDAAFPDHEERIAELRQWLQERRSASSPLRVALELSWASAHEFLEDPDLYRPRIQLFRRHPALREHERLYDQRYEDLVAAYIAQEHPHDPSAALKGRVIAAAIVGAINHTMDVWAADDSVDPEALLTASLELVRQAFAPLLEADGPARDEDLVVVVAASSELRAKLAEVIDEAKGSAPAAPPALRRARR